jgi:hypothetical protein
MQAVRPLTRCSLTQHLCFGCAYLPPVHHAAANAIAATAAAAIAARRPRTASYITHQFQGIEGTLDAIKALHSGGCLRAVVTY